MNRKQFLYSDWRSDDDEEEKEERPKSDSEIGKIGRAHV